MRMRLNFKNPEETDESDEMDELDELVDAEDVEQLRMVLVQDGNDTDDFSNSDLEDDHPDVDPDYLDLDDDDTDDSLNVNGAHNLMADVEKVNNTDDGGGGCSMSKCVAVDNENDVEASGSAFGAAHTLNENEEDDETVRAIITAIKKKNSSPPEIKMEEFITDICFHPERNIIACATITGDVCLYEYSNDENKLLRTVEVHAKACRDVEFSDDGLNLISCSKDKSIMITDMETEKLKKFYESAHDDAINKLYVIDENLFSTGDDTGTIKLWDLRTKDAVFSLKVVEDYITQMLTNDAKKLLLVTSGDGYLTTINISARKLFVQSEPYEEELTCMGIYRGDSKLVVGTSKGNLYTYNWGQFGYHCDKFPNIKTPINVMIPITDRIGCVAGEEGVIRACHIAPFRNLGVVGQHNMPIECLDISNNGELIASASHNSDVQFWNVKYFEDFGDIKYNEKHNSYKEKRHNLPSSKFSNASDFFADLAKSPTDEENN